MRRRQLGRDDEAHVLDGVAYVLPVFEGSRLIVKRVGNFGIGGSFRLSSWSLGFDILKAGLLLQVGPFFVWIAHIDRQTADFEARRKALLKDAPND